MCDGQKRGMQNFLRAQNKRIRSINMVKELASFLNELYLKRTINSDTLPLWIQILRTLTEMCVGNYKNQEVIFNMHIMSIINFIMQIDITNIEKQEVNNVNQCGKKLELSRKGLELKVSAVELLNVMLEKISIHSEMFSHQIAGWLDVEALCWSLFDFYKLKDNPGLVKLKYDDDALRALFKVYHILRHLENTGEISEDELSKSPYHCYMIYEFDRLLCNTRVMEGDFFLSKSFYLV